MLDSLAFWDISLCNIYSRVYPQSDIVDDPTPDDEVMQSLIRKADECQRESDKSKEEASKQKKGK